MNQISYQNKDVTSKLFAEHLTEKSFSVYGIDIPKIKRVLPTNLPEIEANELRLDNLFELEDGTLALVDYESQFLSEDKIKYLNYVVRTLKRNGINLNNVKIRMIVIYTADVTNVKKELDVGCMQFSIEAAYLTSIDTETVYADLQGKISQGETLNDEDLMRLIILPLTIRGEQGKQEYLRKAVELAKEIPEKETQIFALSGIIVFSDKIIEKEYLMQLERWMEMTQLGRLYEERERKAVEEAEERVTKETEERVTKEAEERVTRETEERVIIETYLEFGKSVDKIMDKLIQKFSMSKEEAAQKIQMYTR